MCIKRLLETALDSLAQGDQAKLEDTVQRAWTAILDQRAAHLCKSNQFNEAMQYANKLIRLNPASVEGYRRKADIYYARLQYKRVPFLYRTCLALSLNDEDKPAVIARITEAQFRQRSKVDPFRVLPLEVLETVFRFLEVQDRLRCLTVCSQWRNCLLKSSLWDDLTLDLTHLRTPGYVSSTLPYLGPRLRRLHLTHHPVILDHAFPMLAHHRCANIESLDIQLVKSNRFESPALGYNYPCTLYLTQSLTRLHFHNSRYNAPPSLLQTLLATCPKLVDLSWTVSSQVALLDAPPCLDPYYSAHPGHVTELRYLRWPTQVDILSLDLIPKLCPALRQLWIHGIMINDSNSPGDAIAFLDAILKCCRDLNTLLLGRPIYMAQCAWPAPEEGAIIGQLTTFFYEPFFALSDASVRDVTLQHANSLQNLTLSSLKLDYTTHPDDIPAYTRFPQLKYLEVSRQFDSHLMPFTDPLPNFLLKCQWLHEIALVFISLDPDMVGALLKLPCLQKMTLNNCDTQDALSHLLENAAAQGDACTIKHLVIIQDNLNNPTRVMTALGQIVSLTHLEIWGYLLTEELTRVFAESASRSGLAMSLAFLNLHAYQRGMAVLKEAFMLTDVAGPLTKPFDTELFPIH